jgi:hypothetical protein
MRPAVWAAANVPTVRPSTSGATTSESAERVRGAHRGARGQEAPDLGRERARERREAERDVAGANDPARPQALGQCAREELEHREGHHVGRDRGGDLPERGVEPRGDVRDDRDEHGAAERPQEAADVEREGDAAHGAVGYAPP